LKTLTQEARNVQNPALGAGLLWRFACGYIEKHPTHDVAPLGLFFIVLPIVLHERTEGIASSTQIGSGMRAFAAKFGRSENAIQDVLFAIHGRALRLRTLTLESMRVALATRLLHMNRNGCLAPLSRSRAEAGIPREIRRLLRTAEKLGAWCSQLTMHEVATTLKLRF
jgi:hypothetical protein